MRKIESPHNIDAELVVKLLHSDQHLGLQNPEVEKRRLEFGSNELTAKTHRSILQILLAQFLNLLVWVLVAASILALIFGEYLDSIAIGIVIVINAIIGFIMELQAQRSMDALKKLSQTVARVYREGELKLISASGLVPGDIIYVEAGDMVPADSRLLQENDLAVSEAALTGESIHVNKDTEALSVKMAIADQTNMLFKGTMVTRGNGKAIVVFTGKSTELGHIAALTSATEDEITPLEKKLAVLSRKLIGLTIILALALILIGLIQVRSIYLLVETSIALAIAAIPEGLPIVATIALARGMLKLADQRVIVKQLSAVETLGETDVILTDKTGTLTKNELLPDSIIFLFDTISDIWENAALAIVDQHLSKSTPFHHLIKVSTLCNNALLADGENNKDIGDPLEIALLKMVDRYGFNTSNMRKAYPRIKEIPFDSHTKMMGTLHKARDRNGYLVCIKGAVEVVVAESDYILTREGKKPFTDKQIWLDREDELAAAGLRVLALAYAVINEAKDDFFQNLNFIGLIAFLDPPRKEIKDAVATCHQAGIRVLMLTGDHPETAKNIATRVGMITKSDEKVWHGNQLEDMNDLTMEKQIELKEINVFARVTPPQKLDIVKFYQKSGATVAMIGDGVNDTPALKKADIGIAMGKRGTEAAKEVADLVLKDDAFTSIVFAIRQGRGIFENIRHFVVYLLSCNLSEILLVAMAFFTNLPLPLLPLQILFINMVTDVFPAFALGMGPGPEDVMMMPPRSKNSPIIDKEMWKAIVVYAISITMASFGALIYADIVLNASPVLANNFAFYTLILAQLWHVFNISASNKSFFFNEITHNKYIWWSLFTSITIVVLAYYIPVISDVLHLVYFPIDYIVYVLVFSMLPVIIVQLLKRFNMVV